MNRLRCRNLVKDLLPRIQRTYLQLVDIFLKMPIIKFPRIWVLHSVCFDVKRTPAAADNSNSDVKDQFFGVVRELHVKLSAEHCDDGVSLKLLIKYVVCVRIWTLVHDKV